jgi:hypothetical protein
VALTRAKTWVAKLLYHQSAAFDILTLNKWTWWDCKETLQYGSNGVKGGTNAWTVRGSSDASTAGLDGTDRLTDYAKFVFATSGARSWIVLQQGNVGVAPGYMQLLLDCSIASSQGAAMLISISPAAGFTGGSTTVAPTATDAVSLNAGDVLPTTIPTTKSGGVLRVMASDGQSTRAFLCNGGVVQALLWVEKARNPEAYWTNPYVGFVKAPTIANLVQTAAAGPKTTLAASTTTLRLSGETVAGGLATETLLNRPDGDGCWNFLPTGFISENTASRGKPGEPWDMYLAPSVLPDGAYARGTGDPWDWIVMGDLLIGWDGSQPAIP